MGDAWGGHLAALRGVARIQKKAPGIAESLIVIRLLVDYLTATFLPFWMKMPF